MADNPVNYLVFISVEARERLGWKLLADYLLLRGRGARRPALVALGRFVTEVKVWPFDVRQALCVWMIEKFGAHRIPSPLLWEVVQPTLEEWSQKGPDSAQQQVMLAALGIGDVVDRYKAALRIDPECDEARKRLCLMLLENVDQNQHHMPALYISDPTNDLLDIAEAEAMWSGREDREAARYCLEEIRLYRLNAESWLQQRRPSAL